MKKGEIPKLDSEWWKKNKAKTLLKTGVGEAIRVYEAKMDKFDFEAALKALKDVKAKAAAAATKCNDTLHSDTKEALLKYPKVIADQEKYLKAKIEEEANKPPPPPKQKMGNPELFWSMSIGPKFFEAHGKDLKWLKSLTGGKLEMHINADMQALLKAEKAEVIAQRMVDSANKLFEKCLDDIYKKVKDSALPSDEEKLEELTDAANEVLTASTPLFKKIPAEEWKKFVAKKQQYKDYQIKVGINVAITTLKGIGTGLAIAAAVPTGGASLALAVVGGVNTVADAIKQIRDAAMEAESVLKGLVKNLGQMKKEFDDTKKKAGAQAKEVGKTIFDTIINYPIFPTVKSCGDDCKLASNKTAGLNVKHVKLGGDVSKALKKLDDLDKVISKAPPKTVGKIQKDIIKIRKNLSDALDKCSTIGARVTNCEEICEQVEKLLAAVEEGAGKWLNVFEKVFPVVYNLALAGATAGVGFADAKTALETANTAIGLSNDVLTEVKKQVEDL